MADGPVVQWSERAAHNGVVAGSNPAGPTILLCASQILRFRLAAGSGSFSRGLSVI